MRIIGGKIRGLALTNVGKGDAASHLRPTTDRVRENLFNLLSGGRFGDPLTSAHVLDLFAGTGALGLEAWSRGAARVTFVDDGRVAQKLLRENIAKAGANAHLLSKDATLLPENTGARCSLVFLDPPYGAGLGQRALESAKAGGWLDSDALVVWEDDAPHPAVAGFTLLDTRRYGKTHITLLSAHFGDC